MYEVPDEVDVSIPSWLIAVPHKWDDDSTVAIVLLLMNYRVAIVTSSPMPVLYLFFSWPIFLLAAWWLHAISDEFPSQELYASYTFVNPRWRFPSNIPNKIFLLQDKIYGPLPVALDFQPRQQIQPFLDIHYPIIVLFSINLILHYSKEAIFDGLSDGTLFMGDIPNNQPSFIQFIGILADKWHVEYRLKRLTYTFSVSKHYHFERLLNVASEVTDVFSIHITVDFSHGFTEIKP